MSDLGRRFAAMATGTLLSRVTGVGRLFALAYAVGATRTSDTYTTANKLPNQIYELLLGGVLTATLVPVFVDALAKQGDDDSDEDPWRGVGAVISLVTVIAVGATLVVLVVAPWLVAIPFAGNDTATADAQREVGTFLLRLFAPQVALYGVVAVATAVLHARRRFTAPKFAPIANNAVVMAVLFAFPHVADRLDIASLNQDRGAVLFLGLGTTAGVLAMTLALLVGFRGGVARGLRLVWDPGHPIIRRMVRLSAWTVGFVALNQAALLAVVTLANRRSGDATSYDYAYVFFLLPHAVVGVTVMDGLQTDLAEHWSRADRRQFAAEVVRGLRLSLLVLVPAAVGYAILARPIVSVVLEHGLLTSARAALTADTLGVFAAGLPGFTVFLFLTRAFQAMHDARTVFWLYLIENGTNVVVALAVYERWGVPGLAFSYSVAYLLAAAIGLGLLRSRLGPFGGRGLALAVGRVVAAAAAMGAVVVVVARLADPAGALVQTAAGVIAGVTVYLMVARGLGTEELSQLLPRRGARR